MTTTKSRFIKSGMVLILSAALLLTLFTVAFAAQPGQSCQAQPMTPGNSAFGPGSAFNTSGVSGTMYAGTQPQNSNNPKSVSQYDVACFQVSTHH